ncbi:MULTISPECIES: hypothetical protein [unclassified Mesorhizobium]|uniref:hypothetical protein n=1 Tax=unclassified Mesorhizobium TaxID=325217 RepID=UPI001126376B|nr:MULTISPECIES: hypothetical protein [unclassified Mesorhizobium]MBZ9974243.1 hypothetical protein [Mesorhizobium sp. BR-1-1-10]TPK10264.1 hypothetical protein FJ543_22320 [Mesorhizobium sp. B2-5-7]
MSVRARELFNSYVVNTLNHPDLKGLGIGTHVFSLTRLASEADIPMVEVVAEVGPIAAALAKRTI